MAKTKWTDDEMADFMADLGETESPANDNVKRHRLKGRTLRELADLADPEFILPGYMPEGLTVIYSLPKRGKTFWVIELSLCFAAGEPFHGIELPKSGRVLYIAGEGGAAALRNRAMRVIAKRSFDLDSINDKWILIDTAIDLNSQASCDELLEQNPGHFDLVVIDTLARNMSGDENSTQEMNTAVRACDYIRRKVKARAVALLHHEGWSKVRPRGAIALFGALDCLIHLTRDDGVTAVTVEDARDFAVPEASLYYILQDGTLEPTDPEPVGVAALVVRESAMHAILTGLCPTGAAIPLDQWQAAIESAGHVKGSKKVRWQQFDRAKKRLLSAGLIKITGKQVQPWQSAPTEFKDDDPS
jgi:hypothetical protein